MRFLLFECRVILAALALAASVPIGAKVTRPLQVTGFTCVAQSGETRLLNIDLRRGRFDRGDGEHKLYHVSDTTVEIEGPNPDLVADGPMGPILRSLSLDRRTLVLTDSTSMPTRNFSRVTAYQCKLGPTIDFTIGRRF